MKHYTVNKTIKLTQIQNETLNVLKYIYKINTQKFIRDAINEKIQKDYKNIKVKKEKIYCPF